MFRLVIIFTPVLFIISITHSQIHYQCNFDDSILIPCELIPNGTAPELQRKSFVSLSDLSVDPMLPLSDVKSITATTTSKDDLKCQIPYQIQENSKALYFCTSLTELSGQASCITRDNIKKECVLGKYAVVQLESAVTYTYYVKITGTINQSCLSFYYYLTRSNDGTIGIWHSESRNSEIHHIGHVSNVLYNGWHYAEFTFYPKVTDYYVYFDLQRIKTSNQQFYIALDQIMINNGRCESDLMETNISGGASSTTKSTIQSDPISILQSLPPILRKKRNTPSTTPATSPILVPQYRCDFTTPCFADDQLNRTNGSQFYPSTLHNNTKPPLAPTSDITSIIEPTADDQYCQLPYHLSLDNTSQTTGWNMWFCYQQQCPTIDEQWATCASGLYALISLDSNQKSKTIIDSLLTFNDEQCLRFYYYFTVDEQQSDWGQQIQVWIRPENQTEHRFLLSNLTVMNMTDYKWESNEVTFNVKSLNYTLEFVFEVTMINENEEVYFALDNLEVYDYNCAYVRTSKIISITTTTLMTTQIPITTSTIKGDQIISSSTHPPNWGLIISLTLGLGVSTLGLIIGFIVYHVRMKRRIAKSRVNINGSDIRMYSLENHYDDEDIVTHHF